MVTRNNLVDSRRYVGRVVKDGATRWRIVAVERQEMTDTYLLHDDATGRWANVPANVLRPLFDAADHAG